jgi:hypothetical protein
LGKNDLNYRGIFILDNIKTKEEAEELLNTDPAIKNQLPDYEIYSWYGSAALREYLPFADKIGKVNLKQ